MMMWGKSNATRTNEQSNKCSQKHEGQKKRLKKQRVKMNEWNKHNDDDAEEEVKKRKEKKMRMNELSHLIIHLNSHKNR